MLFVLSIGPAALFLLGCRPEAARWARTVSGNAVDSGFFSAAADAAGNVYAAGRINGQEEYAFGKGVTVTGGSGQYNVLLAKYDGDGTARARLQREWPKTSATRSLSDALCALDRTVSSISLSSAASAVFG
jgi:hypothetical protein